MEAYHDKTTPDAEQLFYMISDYLVAHGERYDMEEVGEDDAEVAPQEYTMALNPEKINDVFMQYNKVGTVNFANIAYSDAYLVDLHDSESVPPTCQLTIYGSIPNPADATSPLLREQTYELRVKNGEWGMSISELIRDPSLPMSPADRMLEFITQRPRPLDSDEQAILTTIAIDLSDFVTANPSSNL